MRAPFILLIALALGAVGCTSASPQRTFTLQGQIISVTSDHLSAVIKHDEIKGFMMAMTMAYKVKDAQLLASLMPGDVITATLNVETNDAYLTNVKKVGSAPLEKPAEAPAASSGFELLKVGDAVPDASFVDQDGKKRSFSSFRGSPVAITFIYTKCPLPTFCPLMDRHFASFQATTKNDAALKKVHLVSVSFDPITDTPAVLKAHARGLKADLTRWTFLTGDRDEIDQFASRFGVSISRELDKPTDISHTLRTAIVDADGKLVKVYVGNEWTPAQLIEDLKPVAHGD